MPRRKQNYPKRLKCSHADGADGQQQTCDSGGENSELTSDEEGEEEDPLNDQKKSPASPETEDTPTCDTKAEESLDRSDQQNDVQEKMDTDDSDLVSVNKHRESPNSSSSVIKSMASIVSNTETSKYSDSTKTMSKRIPASSRFSVYADQDSNEPLDLSKKTDIPKLKKSSISNGHPPVPAPLGFPSSLQSLQQRFGGDFPIEPPRRPSNTIPLQSTMIQGKPLLRSPLIVPSPNHTRISPTLESHKPQPSPKQKMPNLSSSPAKKATRPAPEEMDKNSKYTMHRCSCQKTFTTLYALSVHLQETGHVPGSPKTASLMDYPKLVRGQDMWLNQESEQTRKILRCIQCGESFKTLPMLTVHMMRTQHYAKIVSSDHGRRSHKCSAYCEKEMDRECIFKCKVCHDTFTDMEGLANHMIHSGHHKRQVLRTQNYPDLSMRARRKRYYSEESNSGASPTVASLLDYKKKCVTHGSNGFNTEGSSLDIDSSISCENCGLKIEMHNFVEHVRSCLRRKPDVIGALKMKLSTDESSRDFKSNIQKPASPKLLKSRDEFFLTRSPKNSSPHSPAVAVNAEKHVNGKHKLEEENLEKTVHHNKDLVDRDDNRSDELSSYKQDGHTNNHEPPEHTVEIKKEIELEPVSPQEATPATVKQERSRSVSPAKELSVSSSLQDRSEARSPQSAEEYEASESRLSLEIIDPNSSETAEDGKSALKAMESFINRSFSTKFDHPRGSMMNMMHSFNTSGLPLSGISPGKAESAFNYFGKLGKFFNDFHPFQLEQSPRKSSYELDLARSNEKHPKDKEPKKTSTSEKRDLSREKANNETKVSSPRPEESRNNADSPSKDSSEESSSETLVNKYLNVEEAEAPSTKSSALDSLSSFVYGQPMTSEHPLDSLQKLLTKTDIPKMLQQTHGNVCSLTSFMSPSDSVSLPLNLSMKTSRSDDEDDEHYDEHAEALAHLDRGSPALGCDGELLEYKCAACSRQFASKGSYRYHLSRCHLSSVKKYGIKEAFNMSPYVYLPLDHTAKFTKYYEMAHELANKGK